MSDTSSTDGTQVILDYTSRDFAAIRTQLVGLAKGFMPEWETAGEVGDFGTLLMELFAYMGDVLNFYIDRAASEAFLGTALRRQSVLYIADMFGYKPIGQNSASVVLEFTLDPQAEGPVELPPYTRIYNETRDASDTIVFELDTPVYLDPANEATRLAVVGTATEGITVRDTLVGTSFGGPAQEYIIPEKGVVAGSIILTSVEGGQVVSWSEITDISLGRPTQTVYTTYLDDYENTHILFGDNSSGRIPPVNSKIYGTYRVGVGVEANAIAAGDLNLIAASADLSDQMWAVSVTNPRSPVGGTDPESIDSMRFSIPRSAGRIRNRAITLNDYADLALRVPGVAKSTAYGTLYTLVHVRIAPVGGVGDVTYMKKLCAKTEAFLSDKVLVGSGIVVEPTDLEAAGTVGLWQNVNIRFVVHVLPAYNRTAVRLEVDRVIRAVLGFDSVDFGTRISMGLMYRSALAVQGVEWVDLNWLATTVPTHAQEIAIDGNSTLRTVGEVVTDTLLIPRIYQYPKPGTPGAPATDPLYVDPGKHLESAVDFPNMTEDERTHDGLWVKAYGGLVST